MSKLNAQTLEEMRNLSMPVVVINTVNNELPTCEFVEHPAGAMGTSIINATKVPCSIKILLKNDTLYNSGEYKADTSGATIKLRGNTSATGLQKPYKLKLEKKADLLCRNNKKYKDNEFILISTLNNCLNAYMGYTLNELMDMPYKPGFKLVNVFINDEFRGTYYLVESVKRNKDCRINVNKETGYIFEFDAYWWNEDYSIPLEFDVKSMRFTLKYPDTKDSIDEQKEYIEGWLKEMQLAVLDGHSEDYLSVDTCARWIIAQDLLGISDGAGSNLFFAKEDNTDSTKGYIPTLWDFDTICKGEENEWSSPHKSKTFFFYRMFHYDTSRVFTTEYCRRWIAMKNFHTTKKLMRAINNFASSEEGESFEIAYNLTVSKYRNQDIDWKITDKVKFYEDWFTNREKWMDEAINTQFPKIMTMLKQTTVVKDVYSDDMLKTDLNSQAYDILGRKVSSSYKGIKLNSKRKIMIRH